MMIVKAHQLNFMLLGSTDQKFSKHKNQALYHLLHMCRCKSPMQIKMAVSAAWLSALVKRPKTVHKLKIVGSVYLQPYFSLLAQAA